VKEAAEVAAAAAEEAVEVAAALAAAEAAEAAAWEGAEELGSLGRVTRVGVEVESDAEAEALLAETLGDLDEGMGALVYIYIRRPGNGVRAEVGTHRRSCSVSLIAAACQSISHER